MDKNRLIANARSAVLNVRMVASLSLCVCAMEETAWRAWQLPTIGVRSAWGRRAAWRQLGERTAEEFPRAGAHRYVRARTRLEHVPIAGYLSDRQKTVIWIPEKGAGDVQSIGRYYTAQFALAPTLLEFDVLHALVLIDCPTVAESLERARQRGLDVCETFGDGLVLARPRSPRTTH